MPLAALQSLVARALLDRSTRQTILHAALPQFGAQASDWHQLRGIPAGELNRISYYTLGLRAVTLQRLLPRTWALLPANFSPVWMEHYMSEYPSTIASGLSALAELERFRDFLTARACKGYLSLEVKESVELESLVFQLNTDADYWQTVPGQPAPGEPLALSAHVRFLPRSARPSHEYLIYGGLEDRKVHALSVPKTLADLLRSLPSPATSPSSTLTTKLMNRGILQRKIPA